MSLTKEPDSDGGHEHTLVAKVHQLQLGGGRDLRLVGHAAFPWSLSGYRSRGLKVQTEQGRAFSVHHLRRGEDGRETHLDGRLGAQINGYVAASGFFLPENGYMYLKTPL